METPREADSLRRWRGAALLVGVALVCVAYHRTFDVRFFFDDTNDILGDPSIRSLWPAPWLRGAVRPVVTFSFALDYALHGFSTPWWHATNLAVHVASVAVLFDLLRSTFSSNALGARFGARATWLSGVGAALWGLHPLHTSAVTYVVHRYESLAGLFYLGAMALFARSVVSERPRWFRVLAVVSCAIGMASKEMVVTAPAVILLYDAAFFAGGILAAVRARWRTHVPMFATIGIVAWLVARGGRASSQGFGFDDLTPRIYATSELGVLTKYLRLTVWPTDLSVDYWDWPVAHGIADVWASAIVIALIVGAGLLALRTSPAIAFVLLAWLVVLLPTSSLIPLKGELLAERRMYVPLAFLVPSGVVLVDLRVARVAVVRTTLPALLLLALLFVTLRRNDEFRDIRAMYGALVARHPTNTRARYQYATELEAEGHTEEAFAEYSRAYADEPRCFSCANNVATLLSRKGRFDEAEPIFRAAVGMMPGEPTFRSNLAACLAARGKWREAEDEQRRSVAENPDPVQLERLARWLATAPEGDARNGEEAVRVALAALEASSRAGLPKARYVATLACALAESGLWDDAIRTIDALGSELRAEGKGTVTVDAMKARFVAHEPVREAPVTR